jgi:hypothetical protein
MTGWAGMLIGRLIGRQPSRPEQKADYSPQCHAKVRNEWHYTSALLMPSQCTQR